MEQMTFKAFSSSLENDDVNAHFQKYWAPYLSIVKICNSALDCGYKKPFWQTLRGNSGTFGIASPGARTTVMLPDGTLIVVGGWTTNAEGKKVPLSQIVVDVNGAKGPNTYGKDVFFFSYANNDFVPFASHLPDATINANCSKTGEGMYCAAKIIKVDKWKINYW